MSYQFRFKTETRNENTILQSFLGEIRNVGDENQNLIQTYTVTRVDHRTGDKRVMGEGIVPPNNQGLVTPLYNRGQQRRSPGKGRRCGQRRSGPLHETIDR